MIQLDDLPPKLKEQARRKLNTSYNKYNATKTIIDGIKFDSKKEASRYSSLKLLERAGAISDLELQPKFTLQDSFIYRGHKIRAITYKADFRYILNGRTIVEDVKGDKTDVYKLKKKIFLRLYGDQVDFREV